VKAFDAAFLTGFVICIIALVLAFLAHDAKVEEKAEAPSECKA
jgi:hypothetical protein